MAAPVFILTLQHGSLNQADFGCETTLELLVPLVLDSIPVLLMGEWTVLDPSHPTGEIMVCWCPFQVEHLPIQPVGSKNVFSLSDKFNCL